MGENTLISVKSEEVCTTHAPALLNSPSLIDEDQKRNDIPSQNRVIFNAGPLQLHSLKLSSSFLF